MKRKIPPIRKAPRNAEFSDEHYLMNLKRQHDVYVDSDLPIHPKPTNGTTHKQHSGFGTGMGSQLPIDQLSQFPR